MCSSERKLGPELYLHLLCKYYCKRAYECREHMERLAGMDSLVWWLDSLL